MMQRGDMAFLAGTGRGIGRAVALEMARHGARLVVCSPTFSEVEKVVNRIMEESCEAFALSCDVADAERVQNSFQ